MKEIVCWVTQDATSRGQVTLQPVIKEKTESVHFTVIMLPRRQPLPDIITVSNKNIILKRLQIH